MLNRLNVALTTTNEGMTELSRVMTEEIPKELEGITGLGTEVTVYFFT
jgi:hypothetical protein